MDVLTAMFSGFKARVFWSITILVLLLAALLTATTIYQRAEALKEQIKKRGNSIAKNLAQNSELGILTTNADFLRPVMKTLRADSALLYAVVYNHEGSVLHSEVDEQSQISIPLEVDHSIRQKFVNSNEVIWQSGIYYMFWSPVYSADSAQDESLLFDESVDENDSLSSGDSTLVGYVNVGISLNEIDVRTREAITASAAILSIFLPLSFLIAYLIAARITKPLGKLVKLTDSVTKGDLSQRLNFNGEDEIAHLAKSFNSMIDAVRKRDDDLRTAHDSLEQRVRERTEELAHNNVQLMRRNEELDQFAYVAAHDLKTPLRGIANLSTWIEDDIGDQLDEESRKHLDLMRRRVHRMEALIDAMRECTRAGREDSVIEQVDTNTLVKEIIDELDVPEDFTISVSADMPVFSTIKERLKSVLFHLIDNGIQHNPNAKGEVNIQAKDMGHFYEFRVADNGPGIELEFRKKVFVIFQKLETRDANETTGVGLTLAKKIVDEQGGIIFIEDNKEQGSVFVFSWPKQSEEVTA